MHCDIAVLDDIVVYENAYTGEGRNKVKSQYSLLSSIEGAEAREWVVGTRYHPADLYNDLLQMEEDLYDDDGNKVGEETIYEIFERPVEDNGDGTGQMLWPRSQRRDGKWFGFDLKVLAKKRGQYLDKGQFRAQYYNDPSDPDNVPVGSDKFQYFERKHLRQENGYWFYRDNKLNVYAAVDFAFSLSKKADYTAIVVIGIDAENNVYVLDIDRFKTDRISDYFDHIFQLSTKWSFRKMRAETTVAQVAIVKQLKELVKQHGLSLSIEEFRPNKHQGNKQERISAALEPRYDNLSMWHYRGGNTQILEEELSSRNPPHDDVIDALASVVDMAVKPSRTVRRDRDNVVQFNKRFGGVSF
jgi:phage terminase large subunit-like protein